MKKWARHLFQPNLPLKESGRVTCSEEHIALSLKAAEEGMVLLKNEDKLLPLKKGTKVALFGKGTFDYVKGGGGSGGYQTYEGIGLSAGGDGEVNTGGGGGGGGSRYNPSGQQWSGSNGGNGGSGIVIIRCKHIPRGMGIVVR